MEQMLIHINTDKWKRFKKNIHIVLDIEDLDFIFGPQGNHEKNEMDILEEKMQEKNNNLVGKNIILFDGSIKDAKNTKENKSNCLIVFCLALIPHHIDIDGNIFYLPFEIKKEKIDVQNNNKNNIQL